MHSSSSSGPEAARKDPARYPLLDALIERRSRRFARGMALDGGPLAYVSTRSPQPLSVSDEAALAFAAAGITGNALAELPYESGLAPESGGGNIMTHFVGRTAASGDAMHDNAVCVINDEGVWLLRRPQELNHRELPELIALARDRRIVEVYERLRIRLEESRVDLPRELPFVAPFNKWSQNQPGTTYFLPIAECTALYINIMLSVFSEDFAYLVLDDRAGFQPAGVGAFSKSAGGHLFDDPASGRVATVSTLETWLYEFIAVETGAILQNLGLMTQALGLGGFPHFAAHPFGWTSALGFRMDAIALSRLIGVPEGAGPADEPRIPYAVGLERGEEILIKPYCPPYFPSIREAVLAFVDHKFAAETGTFRGADQPHGWREGIGMPHAIPRYSDRTIEATITYCEYVFDRYGRFPIQSGPFRTLISYQAHHLDLDFYEHFYRQEAISETQRSRESQP